MRGDDGGREAEFQEVEKEEAVAARGDPVPDVSTMDVAVGFHARKWSEVGEVVGDGEVGDARRRGDLE